MSTQPHPSSNPIDDAFQRYKKHAVDDRGKMREKPVPPPQVSARLSWISSLTIGAGAGLAFGLASQAINLLLLPGIPLAPAPFGIVGNILFYLALGGLIGLFSNLNMRVQGIILAVLLAADFLLFLHGVVVRPDSTFQMVLDYLLASFFFLGATFLAIFLIMPVGLVIRWAVNTECENFYKSWWSWQRIRLPMILIILAGLSGALFLYAPMERYGVNVMNKLVQEGLSATSESELPHTLKKMSGTKFWHNAQGSYGIRAERDTSPESTFRGFTTRYNSLYISSIFHNGYKLTCRLDQSGFLIDCRGK